MILLETLGRQRHDVRETIHAYILVKIDHSMRDLSFMTIQSNFTSFNQRPIVQNAKSPNTICSGKKKCRSKKDVKTFSLPS